MKDSYRNSAGIYDLLFDGMNKGLRLVGIRMFRPQQGMNILDVGCGTGTHLELYKRFKCNLYGLDSSPAMVAVARKRLAGEAQLDLGNAASMPYEGGMFDLVICMLTLHEMSPASRTAVMAEIKRVKKIDGRVLLIDFYPGPYQPMQGWISRGIIFCAELAAGRQHFKNHRIFLSEGGLTTLISQHDLLVEKQQILAGGTLSVHLVY